MKGGILRHLKIKNKKVINIFNIFYRNKSGIWGWRQDKSEIVSDYNCKVFSASNVEFVTKSRTEHMNEHNKAKLNNTKNAIQSILGSSEEKCVSFY